MQEFIKNKLLINLLMVRLAVNCAHLYLTLIVYTVKNSAIETFISKSYQLVIELLHD